jgi:hypothetical protein
LWDNTCTIKSRCESELGIVVGKSTIDRFIKGFNYSMKRVNTIPEKRNYLEHIMKRLDYANYFSILQSEMHDSKFYFIDEVGFNILMSARRGKSLFGSRQCKQYSDYETETFPMLFYVEKWCFRL